MKWSMKQILRPKPPTYELLELLGQGANGCVHRAVRLDAAGAIRHEVAVKVLNSKNLVEVWREEFSSLVRARSTNCVRVFGFEWIEERPALVLELIEGVNLEELIDEQRLSSTELIWVGQEIARGLRDLGQQRLCHGDLSLRNVMVTLNGDVRLLDFGLGNSAEGIWRWTPEFAAPEVVAGCMPSLSSDWWSLGQLLRRLGARKSVYLRALQTPSPADRVWRAREIAKPLTLAAKVAAAELSKRQRWGQTCEPALRQPSIKPTSRTKQAACASLVIVFLLILSGASATGRSATPSGEAQLRFRSNHGIEVHLNGRRLGFVPLDLARLPIGEHRLEWVWQGKRGRRILTLHAGDHILIDDQVFQTP